MTLRSRLTALDRRVLGQPPSSDEPPTRAQLWLYRHRTAWRVIGVVGVLAAVTTGVLRLVAGEGVFTGLASLAAGGGFASMLISVHVVQRDVEQRGHAPGGVGG